MKIRFIFALFALASAAAVASPLPDKPHVYVEGSAAVTAEPDEMRFSVTLEHTADTLGQAKTVVDERSHILIDLSKKMGIKERDIATTALRVNPSYTYENNRQEMGRVSMPEDVLSTIAGKVLIESGGRARAHSSADARGIMQLSLAALKDCGLNERFHFHRMAQIDCALRLLDQNHRVLQPKFEQRFGHLPQAKSQELYAMLLLQAYHGGAGLVGRLLQDEQLGGAAAYFAEHHQQFTAGDIALGLIFHNLGRDRVGFASLYYVVDVGIARLTACSAVNDLPGCD